MSSFVRFVRHSTRHITSQRAANRRHWCSVLPTTKWNPVLSRHASTDGHRYVRIEKEQGYAVMRMGRKPVNALNAKLLTEITEAVKSVESDPTMEGLILTSDLPTIFSAGLDISQMYQQSTESLAAFWGRILEMWLTLYGTRLAVVAAINGHAPAGGCFLASSCDYRIMADGPYSIGLTEVLVGISPQTFIVDTVANTIGQREAEKSLEFGLMYTPQEALRIGLVDEVVPKDHVMDRAKTQVEKWVEIPGVARSACKFQLREPTLQKLRSSMEEETKIFVNQIQSETTQKIMQKNLEKLKKK